MKMKNGPMSMSTARMKNMSVFRRPILSEAEPNTDCRMSATMAFAE